MPSRFLEPYRAQYFFTELCLHVVTVIYYCRVREILLYEFVVRRVHVHGYCFYLRQIFHVDLLEEFVEICYRTTFTYPYDIAFIYVHDACRVSMTFMYCKLIYR